MKSKGLFLRFLTHSLHDSEFVELTLFREEKSRLLCVSVRFSHTKLTSAILLVVKTVFF